MSIIFREIWMTNIKLIILTICPILLLVVSIRVLCLEKTYKEMTGLTDDLISFLDNEPFRLESEEEKDAYIKYLSDGIIGIKKDSDASVEDLWALYKPLTYFLMAISVLQLSVLAPLLFSKFRIKKDQRKGDSSGL
jgi:hypothetical protein